MCWQNAGRRITVLSKYKNTLLQYNTVLQKMDKIYMLILVSMMKYFITAKLLKPVNLQIDEYWYILAVESKQKLTRIIRLCS